MDLLRLPDRRHRCRCTQWPVQNTIGLHHYKSCIDDIPNGKREFFYRPVLGKVMFLLVSAVLLTGRRGSLYDVTSRLAARSHVPSRGGLCLWSHVPSGSLCLWSHVTSRGLLDREYPLDRNHPPPHMVKSEWYACYWNAFLFVFVFFYFLEGVINLLQLEVKLS